MLEIFSEIVVEKLIHPKNVSQTQWLIHIFHVSTRTWLLVLSMFHSSTCLSTYLETLTVIFWTSMVYSQRPSLASAFFLHLLQLLQPQFESQSPLLRPQNLRGVYMTPGRLSRQREFTSVTSRSSVFVHMIFFFFYAKDLPGSVNAF